MSPGASLPGWEWYSAAIYFFVGGVSTGAYFVGSLAELFGGERYRGLSRMACYVAFPLILLSVPLLALDPGRAVTFRHLLLYSHSALPYVNERSPLSVGSWALVLFGAMSFLSFVDNLVSRRRGGAPFVRDHSGLPRKIYAAVGSTAGFFVAGYTGDVLNLTARPLRIDTDPLVGALFVVSAAAMGGAAVSLIDARRTRGAEVPSEDVAQFGRIVTGTELVLAIAVVAIAGRYAAPLLSGLYALVYWGGAVLPGVVVPLAWTWGAAPARAATGTRLMPVFVLVGGALLRIALVHAGQIR